MRVIRKDKKRTVYGWEENGAFFLATTPRTEGQQSANWYHSKEEAEEYAEKKGVVIQW